MKLKDLQEAFDTSESMELNLSKSQAEELAYQLSIVRDERDLLDDYELTEIEIENLINTIPINGGKWEFNRIYFNMLSDEIESMMDKAHDPWAMSASLQSGEYKSAQNLKRKLNKLR